MPESLLTLKLTRQEAELVAVGLAEMPFKHVSQLQPRIVREALIHFSAADLKAVTTAEKEAKVAP